MQHTISLLPVVPVRAGASDKEEMVTQMIFGDHAIILEKYPKWSFVEIVEDSYRGWISNNMVSALPEGTEPENGLSRHRISGDLFLKVRNDTDGQFMHLTAGSILYDYNPQTRKFKAGVSSFTCQHKPLFYRKETVRQNIQKAAMNFINVPYLWGGKNPFGIDCSGLNQVVFRLFGINLPRDSWQQAEVGHAVDVDRSGPGDVAFFENEKGRVVHTGIITGDNRIIHASGMVRIDILDEKGIYNHTLKEYTHRLQVIKNILE